MKTFMIIVAATIVLLGIATVVFHGNVLSYIDSKDQVYIATSTPIVVDKRDNIDKVIDHYERTLRERKEVKARLDAALIEYDAVVDEYNQAVFNLQVISE